MTELVRNAKYNETEKVPAVFWSYTTARILTIEFLEGITVSEYLRRTEAGNPQAGAGFEPRLFAARLIDHFLGGGFRPGMFHAHLSPGNLVVMAGERGGDI